MIQADVDQDLQLEVVGKNSARRDWTHSRKRCVNMLIAPSTPIHKFVASFTGPQIMQLSQHMALVCRLKCFMLPAR